MQAKGDCCVSCIGSAFPPCFFSSISAFAFKKKKLPSLALTLISLSRCHAKQLLQEAPISKGMRGETCSIPEPEHIQNLVQRKMGKFTPFSHPPKQLALEKIKRFSSPFHRMRFYWVPSVVKPPFYSKEAKQKSLFLPERLKKSGNCNPLCRLFLKWVFPNGF